MQHANEQSMVAGDIERHWHERPYAALVIEGCYGEAGLRGRWDIEPGDVVVHQGFEAHQNVIKCGGARVINIPLPHGTFAAGVFAVSDPEHLLATARSNDLEPLEQLKPVQRKSPRMTDWMDVLAVELNDPELRISDWADRGGIALETVSRGFRAAFGIGPARFRRELQVQAALLDLTVTTRSLAAIAADRGFADQPHLTRSIRAMTGRSPGEWRQVKSIQDCQSRLA
jgi:AraC-like DNA-binding protein